MRKLYKYYSNLDLIDFTNPSFKLASAHTLNDPFERIVARELLDYCECLIDKTDRSYLMFKRILGRNASIEKSYDTLLKFCGVVSLSETQHNLLMWAHYANQHRGICIGYKSNVLENVIFPEFEKIPLTKTPLKVNYDSKKVCDYRFELNFNNQNDFIKSVLTKVLTTKGDDWIYEKEHRLIIPISVADRRLSFKDNKRVEAKLNGLRESRYFMKEKTNRKIAYKDACNYAYSYLLDIDPIYITDVYLGCRMEDEKAHKIREHIYNTPSTSHILVHKFKESTERFEIVIDKTF
jgi:hypothetical protein